MPTSLGIMQILAGPPSPPPPCDGCWPTPQETAVATSTASRAVESTFRFLTVPNTLLLLPKNAFQRPLPALAGHVLLLTFAEKLVQEHGHEEQDAEDKELPGARDTGQEQAVAQYRNDDDAEYGPAYGPRAAVDARPSEHDRGDHVQLQPQADVAPGRIDPRGIDHGRDRHEQPDTGVDGHLYPTDGYARETRRLLVIPYGVDVAPEAGAREYEPHDHHGNHEDNELAWHRAEQVRLAEVGEPGREVRDGPRARETVSEPLEEGEGPQSNDERVQAEERYKDAVEESGGHPYHDAEQDGEGQRESRCKGETDGHRDQRQVRPDREIYPTRDYDQGHPERHKAHLDKVARGIEQIPEGKEEGREQAHHDDQRDQDAEQDQLAGEPQAPHDLDRRTHTTSPTSRLRTTSVVTASRIRAPSTACCQMPGTPTSTRPFRMTPMRIAPVRAASEEPRPPVMLVPPITTAATT